MKFIWLLLICEVLVQFSGMAQREMTKDEIFNYWSEVNNARKLKYKDSPRIIPFRKKTVDLIDSLRSLGIDTIAVFSTTHIGLISTDSCSSNKSPNDQYLFWKSKNLNYVTRIRKNCEVESQKIPYAVIFRYYENCKQDLSNETIMPVITGGTKSQNGKISLTEKIIFHEPEFTIYCKIGLDSIMIHFKESDINDEENLFYDHNARLKTVSWFKLVENQIEEIYSYK